MKSQKFLLAGGAAPLAMTVLAAAVAISGCATRSESGSVYSRYDVQREQIVRTGVVETVRYVTIERPESGVGTVSGAVIGGVAGGGIGHGRDSAVGSLVGAVVGGLAGHAIEESANKKNGVELTVRLDNGELRAIVQAADEVFQPGERVRILSSNGMSRVTH